MPSTADLSTFKFEACVDWIELRVRTLPDADGRATNGWSLCNYLRQHDSRVSRAEPVDRGDGGAAMHFLIRIQAPKTFDDVRAVVARIRAYRELAAEPAIAAIEIAFDARPKRSYLGDPAALDQMTLRFMNGLLPPSDGVWLPRQTNEWPPGTGWRDTRLACSPHLDPAETLYIGSPMVASHRNPDYVHDRLIAAYEAAVGTSGWSDERRALDHASWRVYRKETDERFSEHGERLGVLALPPDGHRARAEVTLTGQMLRMLKIETLDDLALFDFTEIIKRDLLRFANSAGKPLPVDDTPPDRFSTRRLFVNALGVSADSPACVIQSLWRQRSRGRKVAKLSPQLRFDNALNDRLRKQLARLTDAFGG